MRSYRLNKALAAPPCSEALQRCSPSWTAAISCSSWIHEMFLTAAWDARGGYAYSACTACGSHPAQGMAWWLDTDDVDVICDTCRTCTRCDERGVRWWSDGDGRGICETCRQRSMGYVSRTAASIRPEAVEWYYAGRVPLGALTLLVGPPGLGKTTFACELAARGSRGELVGAAADVIFATTEDSLAHTLVPRFTAADADLDRVHFMQILEAGFEVGLTLPDHLPRLQDLVEKTGANLIVLDPVVGHLSGNIDSYKDHSVRRALAPLATLAEKHRGSDSRRHASQQVLFDRRADTGERVGRFWCRRSQRPAARRRSQRCRGWAGTATDPRQI